MDVLKIFTRCCIWKITDVVFFIRACYNERVNGEYFPEGVIDRFDKLGGEVSVVIQVVVFITKAFLNASP